MLELDRHVGVIAIGELGGVAPKWKNASFGRYGKGRVEFGSESEGAWLYSHVSQVEDENRSSKASWVILGC